MAGGCGARTPLSVGSRGASEPVDASASGARDASPIVDDAAGAPGTVATGIAELAAGYFHTCARWNDGLVRCWGDDEFGQLGDGMSSASCTEADGGVASCRRTPLLVPGLPRAVHLAAGGNHTCALAGDGTVWCWGANGEGQVGIDTGGLVQTTAVQVPGLTGVMEVAAGGEHTCARVSDGTVYCWGNNDLGQLGDGTGVSRATPAPVLWLNAATGLAYQPIALSLGRYGTCSRLGDGSAICWGQWWTADPSNTSPHVISTRSIGGLIASIGLALDTTCAVLTDGTTWCTSYGGTDPGCGATLQVPNRGRWSWQLAQPMTSVAVGDGGWCTRARDGLVYCDGYSGACCSCAPSQPLGGVTAAAAVATGFAHACALLADQTVECWGDDEFGQLGHGASGDTGVPPELVTW
jgi:alpha-tubulin suppressor-like RCC1 family protein